MSKILTNNQYYSQIANVIREQNGTSNTYTPPQMVTALKDLFYEEVEGVPPITFQGIGENLLDYRIDGASGGVGDKTSNLLQNTASSQTINGVTFTVNNDGSIICNGTSSAVATFAISIKLNSNINYVLSGSPKNGGIETYRLDLRNISYSVYNNTADNGDGINFTVEENGTYLVCIRIAANYTCNNLTFYPMIRLASIQDDTYEPYGYKVPVVVKRKANHTATLQLHDCLPTTMMFDAPEALYYAENGLVAGTYCFTIQNGYDTAYGGGKTYNFTIVNDIEAGGQITFGWSYNTQAINSKITTYKSDLTTVIDGNIPVFEGDSGTNLGTTDGNSTNLNHIQCVRYGSNNYVQGAIRQFLNSSGNVGSVWQSQTKFDRPPDWNSEMAGFLRDLDSNFLAVVGKSRKVVGNNNITNGGGYVTFEDKFFLLSRSEVYGGNESVLINEGEPYPYYSNYSDLSTAGTGNDTNRIKNRNGSAQVWGLRTVITSSASHIRTVNTSGGIGNIYANNKSDGVAPACNIELDEDYKYNGRVLNVKDQISVTKGNDILVFDVIGIDVDEEVYFESETTNIYTDNPIEENESISLSDTNTNIPTIRGTNVLTVDTTVQPSNVYIKSRHESSYETAIRERYESIIADYEQQLASIESSLQEV